MTKSNLSKGAVLFWLASFGLMVGAGAWQASLHARSGKALSPLVVSGKAPVEGDVLDCKQVRSRVGQFLGLHYNFRAFDEKLSERTFERVFETLDPAKVYFVASDLQDLSALRKTIPERLAKNDCSFIDEVHARYVALATERMQSNLKILDAAVAVDTDDEMYVGKPIWAASRAELDATWLKRIKFQIVNFIDADNEAKVRERLQKRYRQQLDALKDQSRDQAYDSFLNAFATALDPHSSHFLPEQQEDFNIRLGNRLEGIGATLKEEDGYISITALIAGGAASRDGRLKVGDKIIGVDPGGASPGLTDTVDMPLSKAVRLIRGAKGTNVKLVILRQSEAGPQRINIELVRDSVLLSESRAKGGILNVDGRKVGVVRLPSFYTDLSCRSRSLTDCNGSAANVLAEINALSAQGISGLILDLRSNGGGDLQESIMLSGLFIPSGPVVQTVDRRRISRTLEDEDGKVYYKGPLAVFISKYSASASEIVAGAIQDYGRGIILGDEHSFGKATVQVIEEIGGTKGRASDGAIKVTQSKFYRPSGKSNQVTGVISDVEIPSVLAAGTIGEREHPFALDSDRIRPASNFAASGDLTSVVPLLRDRSRERIAASKEFAELAERVKKLREQEERAVVSLKARIAEKSAEESKSKADGEGAGESGLQDQAVDPKDFALVEAGRILLDKVDLGIKATASGAKTRP